MDFNSSCLECNSNSSVCYPDFTMNKPAKKVKLRSIVPTPPSLLLGVDESEISKHFKMEEKLRIIDGKRMFSEAFASGSSHFGESKRTEDIFIREDENGIRLHYCPLVSHFDRMGHESENCSDPETENEFYSTWKEAYWRQPLLSAERSPSSDSEDSSTDSIRYAPLENHPTEREKSPTSSLNRILKVFQLPERSSALDGKTMERWLEDSSDEFDESFLIDSELPPKTIGNESDMEEFENDSETETENRSQQTTEDENQGDKKDDGRKDLLFDVESSRDDTESKSSEGFSDKRSESEHSEGKDANEDGQSSDFNNKDDAKSHEENFDEESETNTTAQDFNDEQKKECVSETERKNDGSEQDVLDDFCSKSPTEISTKPNHEENMNKDPREMNIAESKKKNEMVAHPNDGDKSHYEASTDTEVTDGEKEIMSDELTLTEIPLLESDNRSAIYEPFVVEEQRDHSRPRNRLAKFFQSLKKKFDKNKKA